VKAHNRECSCSVSKVVAQWACGGSVRNVLAHSGECSVKTVLAQSCQCGSSVVKMVYC
jgi:hypothetical protein